MSEPNRIDFERLTDWVEGRLSEAEAAAVAEQVAGADEETRAQAEWLRAFARTRQEIKLSPPPPEVREALSRRFAAHAEAHAEEVREPGLLQRLMASLSFDSGLQTAAAGARTAGAEEEQRQLAFSTEIAEIVLDITPRAGGRNLDLSGQIFASGEEVSDGFTVRLLRGESEVDITTSNELGEFTFEDIPYGGYELVLNAGRFEVLIPHFELSP